MPILIDLTLLNGQKVCINSSHVYYFREDNCQAPKHTRIGMNVRVIRVKESYAEVQSRIYAAMQYEAELSGKGR